MAHGQMKIGDWEERKENVAKAMFNYLGKCNKHLKPLNAEMAVLHELAKEHFPHIVAAGEEVARKKTREEGARSPTCRGRW